MKSSDQFPRSKTLPSQSPLFWVQQKDRYLRQLLIRDIEEITGRRLLVYFANRYVENCDINIGDVAQMQELLGDLNGAPADLFLNTTGGQTDATEALISLLQASVQDLRTIVPHSAKSNGTVICLASKEIVMGPPSELGPIDPAVGGTPASILADPVVAKSNFPMHKLGVHAIQQTEKLAKDLLTHGMMNGRPEPEIDATVGSLASKNKYFSHGSVIDHTEAKALGLNINYLPDSDELWQRLWLLYSMYAHDVQQTNVVKIFEGQARSMSITPDLRGQKLP
jgi:Serine dehydrogenase proteinase